VGKNHPLLTDDVFTLLTRAAGQSTTGASTSIAIGRSQRGATPASTPLAKAMIRRRHAGAQWI